MATTPTKEAIYNAIHRAAGRPYHAEGPADAEDALRLLCKDEHGDLVVYYLPRAEFWRIDAAGRAHEIEGS